jgi:1,4-alpha-glucan branching enzyme
MTLLTPEAYAVIEGRHSDPFRYVGPHAENGSAVVRVFLPDAEGVAGARAPRSRQPAAPCRAHA